MSMKKISRHNVRKHIEIKDSDKCITLYISLEFGSLDKMRITSSDPRYYFGRSVKGLITLVGLKNNVRSKK